MAEDDIIIEETELEAEFEYKDFEEVSVETILTEYDSDDFVSGAVLSGNSTIPADIFEFENSYGYNCSKYFNLCACDDSVLAWTAGSIIVFMDVFTKQVWFRRSTTGGSVGHIASYRVDPNYRIAIAESREEEREPLIILYTWPQMDIDAVLRDGTTNSYSVMDFSPDGELLASVGKEPDYNLTIWNWKKHRILLRTSAFSFDVNNVLFSVYCPGQLTTAGAAHVKFWKMAHTFTGLKLKGELGRFGKTEICDVLGVLPMPDEKVLSGSEWGNILVWEAGLVKVEVSRKNRKRCHQGPIVQLMLSEDGGEVTTVSKDGYVRSWYWDTVEQADPPEDDPFVEINPVAETYVPNAAIGCIRRQSGNWWFGQDESGAIWRLDLDLDKIVFDHQIIFRSHSLGIRYLGVIFNEPIFVTLGFAGGLNVYHIEKKCLIARQKYPALGSSMIQIPSDLSPNGTMFLIGLSDGTLRGLNIDIDGLNSIKKQYDPMDPFIGDYINNFMVLKPHKEPVTCISINKQCTILITSSEDSSIFIYKISKNEKPIGLNRAGFIETPNVIRCITWKPGFENVVLLCGDDGLIMEATLPVIEERPYGDLTTFKLEFESTRLTIMLKQKLQHRPLPAEEDLMSLDEEDLKKEKERAKDDDEEEFVFLGEVELVEDVEREPTAITWAQYERAFNAWPDDEDVQEESVVPVKIDDPWIVAEQNEESKEELQDEGSREHALDAEEEELPEEEGGDWSDLIWCCQYDTGALMRIGIGHKKVNKYAPIPNAWNKSIASIQEVCDGKYLIVGMSDGIIRMIRTMKPKEDCEVVYQIRQIKAMERLNRALKGRRLRKPEPDPIPRLDFMDHYYLPMHDCYTGAISNIAFSSDGKRMFTCGYDGNIFSYNINFDKPLIAPLKPGKVEQPKGRELGFAEAPEMSHEEQKQKEEYDKMMHIANMHKKRVRAELAELQVKYNAFLKANRQLPASQQLDVTLDPRPPAEMERELDDAAALVRRKLAFPHEVAELGLHKLMQRYVECLDVFPFIVRSILTENIIEPIRHKILSSEFIEQLDEVHRKMAEAALRARKASKEAILGDLGEVVYEPPRVASFLMDLPPNPPHALFKAIRDYHRRLNRHHHQYIEWEEHLSRRPDPNALPAGADVALKNAEATLGNYPLKTEPDYVAGHDHNTQLKMCLTRQEIYQLQRGFNEKVLKLRVDKVALVALAGEVSCKLAEIRIEIPKIYHKPPPEIPTVDEDLTFPERHLEVKPEIVLPKKDIREKVKPEAAHAASRNVDNFVKNNLQATWEILKPKADEPTTDMEREIIARRIKKRIFEQDALIEMYNKNVDEWEKRLIELRYERVHIQEMTKLLELHLLQLHQEIIVLNQFEAQEDRLTNRVDEKLQQIEGVQSEVASCHARAANHRNTIAKLEADMASYNETFRRMTREDRFADFLRRIYKKKYRAPRDPDDDESSEESSSESSSSEEDLSLDSRDIGPIKPELTVCPEGCDPDKYEKTFALRNARHKAEQDIKDQERLIDQMKKEVDKHAKVIKRLNIQLQARQKDLKEFMMEKQSCLNDIDCTVLLRYDQIRASVIAANKNGSEMKDVIVFSQKKLLSLRKRVLELKQEIIDQRARHKVNKTHLHRMNVDMRTMERNVLDLRAKMREVLTRKLGRPRRVDDVLDTVLQQLARRYKFFVANDNRIFMRDQVISWTKRLSSAEQNYYSAIRNHTDKLRMAAAMQDELQIRLPNKKSVAAGSTFNLDECERDTIRLKIIRTKQQEIIKYLQYEITRLKLKPTEPVRFAEQLPPMSATTESFKADDVQKYIPEWCACDTDWDIWRTAVLAVLAIRAISSPTDFTYNYKTSRELLQRATLGTLKVISGEKSRYDIIMELVEYFQPDHLKSPDVKVFDGIAKLMSLLLSDQGGFGEPKDTGKSMLEGIAGSMLERSDSYQVAVRILASALKILDMTSIDAIVSVIHALLKSIAPTDLMEMDAEKLVSMLHFTKIKVDKLKATIHTIINAVRSQIIDDEDMGQSLEEIINEIQEHEDTYREQRQASKHQRDEDDLLEGLMEMKDIVEFKEESDGDGEEFN